MAPVSPPGLPATISTPLGAEALLLVSLRGNEGLSELFQFDVELLADYAKDIAFDKLLGQKISLSLTLHGGKKRFINGICRSFTQGERDSTFTTYRMEIVPQLWLLTKKVQSRIFQHMSVPDILKSVLTGVELTSEIQGTFEKRDYCVQYRESDFHFASRLMEEEGIYYFFKHAADSHKMILANTTNSHPAMPEFPSIIFETLSGGNRDEARIHTWRKTQEIRSGKVVLWDHSFEKPGDNLNAQAAVQATVQVGKVAHSLTAGGASQLEIYDYPGAYAQRFDGIDAGGGEQPDQVSKIFKDKDRTATLRMQEEATGALRIQGTGNCRHLTSGHKFTLDRHYNANGDYLVTRVEHAIRHNPHRSGTADEFQYSNTFTAIPFAQPFRPKQAHEKPTVQGSQTAVVVGPAGEEIFTDKYGRVKVQFNWDRHGKTNADSACWVRVATQWAGKQWGIIHIPRIGQEVIVDFLEGDPDQPIIVGSVYNAEQMPPWGLPDNKSQSGIITRSTLKGDASNFNALRFEDKKGEEEVWLHAEKNQRIEVENDETHFVGHDRGKTVENDETVTIGNDRKEKVANDETIQIGNDRIKSVAKNETISVGENLSLTVGKNTAITIGASQTLDVGKDQTITVSASRTESVGKDEAISIGGARSVTVGKDDVLSVGKKLTIEAGDQIILKTGSASITMKKDGSILIDGKDITIKGSGAINAKASKDVILKGSKVALN